MLLSQGLSLMIVGMTTVFAFLGLLVAAMKASAALLAEPAPAPPPTAPALDDGAEIAAILAAITHHRARQQEGRP